MSPRLHPDAVHPGDQSRIQADIPRRPPVGGCKTCPSRGRNCYGPDHQPNALTDAHGAVECPQASNAIWSPDLGWSPPQAPRRDSPGTNHGRCQWPSQRESGGRNPTSAAGCGLGLHMHDRTCMHVAQITKAKGNTSAPLLGPCMRASGLGRTAEVRPHRISEVALEKSCPKKTGENK